jgi:hypothetical protein
MKLRLVQRKGESAQGTPQHEPGSRLRVHDESGDAKETIARVEDRWDAGKKSANAAKN